MELAETSMLPAAPFPSLLALSLAPLVTKSDPAAISTLPPLPTAFVLTWLSAPLETPLLATPSKETVSVATSLTSPAFPRPLVLVFSEEPLVTEIDRAVMSTLPPEPTP